MRNHTSPDPTAQKTSKPLHSRDKHNIDDIGTPLKAIVAWVIGLSQKVLLSQM